ncbi:hypothetical protein HELRODRAFT_160578 [Helobdella robusta]|uniref:Uncharacterized protein n=1 Tax=Helobdella robusta TaxID=6412 RepID=T1EQF9_HELRO|nr:hypothetical protein HELRODRAFT_160578 [Helobdella robusta]ESO06407.1 hypothetical protein HELRODRAFT_160578 [Helobdella robusta]
MYNLVMLKDNFEKKDRTQIGSGFRSVPTHHQDFDSDPETTDLKLVHMSLPIIRMQSGAWFQDKCLASSQKRKLPCCASHMKSATDSDRTELNYLVLSRSILKVSTDISLVNISSSNM